MVSMQLDIIQFQAPESKAVLLVKFNHLARPADLSNLETPSRRTAVITAGFQPLVRGPARPGRHGKGLVR